MDEIAIPNSIPTAEGAIQMLWKSYRYYSRQGVSWFGWVGTTLSQINGLNAVVTVVS